MDEIVGEIDETDDETGVRRITGGCVLLPGTFAIHDLPDLGITLDDPPHGNYVTVAGLVLGALGRIPESPGDRVSTGDWTVEVTHVDHHAVTEVRPCPTPALGQPWGGWTRRLRPPSFTGRGHQRPSRYAEPCTALQGGVDVAELAATTLLLRRFRIVLDRRRAGSLFLQEAQERRVNCPTHVGDVDARLGLEPNPERTRAGLHDLEAVHAPHRLNHGLNRQRQQRHASTRRRVEDERIVGAALDRDSRQWAPAGEGASPSVTRSPRTRPSAMSVVARPGAALRVRR